MPEHPRARLTHAAQPDGSQPDGSQPDGSQPNASLDCHLEQSILRLLDQRGAGKTICPSEAARDVARSDERSDWEPLMEPAREAARRLVRADAIVITQRGKVVNPSTAKGPIRLRRR